MNVEITARHMEGGTQHEHIAKVKWEGPGQSGIMTREQLVAWLDAATENRAYVSDSQRNIVWVETVHPTSGAAYARTYSDGKPTNNLLALPTF